MCYEHNREQHKRNGNYYAVTDDRRQSKTNRKQMYSNAAIYAPIVNDEGRRIPSPQNADVRALLCTE